MEDRQSIGAAGEGDVQEARTVTRCEDLCWLDHNDSVELHPFGLTRGKHSNAFVLYIDVVHRQNGYLPTIDSVRVLTGPLYSTGSEFFTLYLYDLDRMPRTPNGERLG